MENQIANKVVVHNPKTGEALEGQFETNSLQDLSGAVKNSEEAFHIYRKVTPGRKAQFLEAIGEEIVNLGDQLIERAVAETGLPEGRVIGERGRTVNQLNLFAKLLREGSWTEASIDTAIPDRAPVPKPDIRKVLIPIGPVAVFTASNFPLAFSTAGGDTASALAAGNPVIVKAHNAHLGTHQLVVSAIKNAASRLELPTGVFQSLTGEDFTIGQELVKHPGICAVGFTGSFSGGKALYDLAVSREVPIPVYAEMSSINPTILLPSATDQQSSELASSLAQSITLGSGQFCTNPGLIIGIASEALDQFCIKLGEEISQISGSTMLHAGIFQNYLDSSEKAISQPGVNVLSKGKLAEAGLIGKPVVVTTTGDNFLSNSSLESEVFGPYSMVVQCKDSQQLTKVVEQIKGQLTITFMADEEDIPSFRNLISLAETKAGRVIFNNLPTGVEVCDSMIHGGPFPATTDSRTTSVGTDAIKRFARPVCFQNAPHELLPEELKNENPLNIMRKINGDFSTGKIESK